MGPVTKYLDPPNRSVDNFFEVGGGGGVTHKACTPS